MWDSSTPCFSIWFRGNWLWATGSVEVCCRDAAVAAEEWRVSGWDQQERLSSLWPLSWRVTSFYSRGPSSLLSSPQCWNFHCGSVFQPVNTHIFHPSWGSSFGRAFLWRSLELIILYFILLYKQHSIAKEHSHKKKPLWGWWWGGEVGECGLKAKRKLLLVQSAAEVIVLSLSSFRSRKMQFTWPPSSWVLAFAVPSPESHPPLAHAW